MRTLVVESASISVSLRWDVAYNLQQRSYQRLGGNNSRWIRMGDVAEVADGLRRVSAREDGVPLLRLSDLQSGEVVLRNALRVGGRVAAKHRLQAGDVLLSKTGEEPQVALVDEACSGAAYAADIYRLRLVAEHISPVWLGTFLRTGYAAQVLAASSYGRHIRRLSVNEVRDLRVPLPPASLLHEVEQLERHAVEHSKAAKALFTATTRSLYSEVDARIGEQRPGQSSQMMARNTWLRDRWDVSYVQARGLAHALADVSIFRPLGEWASLAISTRRHLQPDQMVAFVQVSDLDADYLTFSRLHRARVRELPARVRLPLREYQVLLLASGSSLGEPSHPVAVVEPQLGDCLASNAFMALDFRETPLYFGLALRHPLVLAQLRGLASGSIIQLIGRRDVKQVLIPVLGSVWRQDYNERARMAWDKRRLALELRQRAVATVEAYVAESLGS